MATNQEYELQRLPTPSRPTAVSMSHAQSMLNRNAIVNYSGLRTPRSSPFHPGLLSRTRPEPGPSFLHKLNSIYTAIGLALTLILTIITYRLNVLTWQLSQWTEQKDFHELCLELKQANLTLPRDCKTALADGLAQPPTFMSKRWLYGAEYTMPTLDGYSSRVRHSGIQYQGDAQIMYDGLGEYPLSLPTESSTMEFLITSMEVRQIDFSSQLLLYFAFGFIIQYVVIHLYQKQTKYGPNNRGTRTKNLREARLSNIENQSDCIGITGNRDSNAALAIIDDDTGKQLRERKKHRAETLTKDASRQGKNKRWGRKEKVA